MYLFDRQLHRVTRLNLAVREKRSIGGATPGLDAVAKLQIKIEPLETSANLDDDSGRQSRRPPARTRLRDLRLRIGAARLPRQARSAVVCHQPKRAKRSRSGGSIAATWWPNARSPRCRPKSAGRQTSLEQFQKDVTYSLGKSFGELVSSRQWQNAAGLYCYEVVARGLVEEVPVEWHYYLLAPESGHRVSVAVTIEKPMVERVANADRELVESLQLFPPMPAAQTAELPADARTVK